MGRQTYFKMLPSHPSSFSSVRVLAQSRVVLNHAGHKGCHRIRERKGGGKVIDSETRGRGVNVFK